MTGVLKRLFATFFIIGSVVMASAQQPQMPPIPTDPNVRIGKLENGLTYYIRHNELPEDRETLIKLIQCDIDLHHIVILLLNKIADNQIKFTAVAEGIARPANKIFGLLQI